MSIQKYAVGELVIDVGDDSTTTQALQLGLRLQQNQSITSALIRWPLMAEESTKKSP